MCAARGGVKDCVVTRGIRSIIIDGYPTKEPYTDPGSMNCVCNDDNEQSNSNQNCPPVPPSWYMLPLIPIIVIFGS